MIRRSVVAVVACLLFVLLGTADAWAVDPTPPPAPTDVRVTGISGDALQLLVVLGGLSLATASAALISGFRR